jgi:hypothetical protein
MKISLDRKQSEIERRLSCALTNNPFITLNRDVARVFSDWLFELGVPKDSYFFGIFSKISVGGADRDEDCYVSLGYPTEIIDTTDYIWSQWGMSRDFIALDTIEGQGSTVYSIKTGAVYDFSSWDVEKLNNYEIEPSWPTIEDFLLHFLPETLPEKLQD